MGVWKFNYETGSLSRKVPMQAAYGRATGGFITKAAYPKSEGSYLDDQKTGLWQYYYEDGKRRAMAEYNGKLAFYREFFPAGSPSMEGWLRNETGDSTWRYFHENGNLKAVGTEQNGLKTGLWKFYGPDNKLTSEGEFASGQPNGQWRYYHKNGKWRPKARKKPDGRKGYGSFIPRMASKKPGSIQRRRRHSGRILSRRKNKSPRTGSQRKIRGQMVVFQRRRWQP
jgi:antitoxin component YwqK of YwqJK toxin-antitoxin module